MIYDGGISSSQKSLEQASLQSSLQQVEVDLYSIKERINQVYFYILVLQENTKLMESTASELEEKIKTIESGVKNGFLQASASDALMAEYLKIQQKADELKMEKRTSLNILSELTGSNLAYDVNLALPVIDKISSDSVNRPEYQLFEAQKNQLQVSGKIISSKKMPKIAGFGQFGYGKPGLNMMNDEADNFYMVGARISWNIWDWNDGKRDREAIKVQQQLVDNRREIFDKNLSVSLAKERSGIEKMEKLIETDKQIIGLREKITRRSESQMNNGTLTSSDYISDLNAEVQAKINFQIHKIQLVQTKINYLTLLGTKIQ